MAGDAKKEKTRVSKTSKMSEKEKVSLDFIQDLGGTKDDLWLINDVGDDDMEDFDAPSNDFETEPIKKDEVRDFLQNLGIADHRPEEMRKESKKTKKLLKAKVPEEEQQVVTSESSQTEKKKKKDRKNNFKVQDNEITSTTSSQEEELRNHIKTNSERTYLLIKPESIWLDEEAMSPQQVGAGAEDITKTLLQQCEQFAAKLLEDEVALYKKKREKTKKGDSNWIRTVLSSGTLSDKMAALTVLVQESPAHNMTALDSLVTMTKKKGKREAMLAADTLKNLLVSEISPLPDHRKLIPFDARPVSTLWQTCSGNKDSVDRRLMAWYAEDQLKQKYSAFVKALDVMSYDTLLATKEKALAVTHSLLVSKPEQENALLPMLVNKLGDPNHKVASKASYLLLKVVEQHPNMKTVIVGEVKRLVYRPNVAQRAQYYAMCFLNQIKLHKADHALATQLITIFFAFFKIYVKKGEVDSKMMAALLTGVNRAYPYAKSKCDFLAEQVTTLYKIIHMVNFNTGVQALMLLNQVVDPSNSDSDRYFMALYRKLLDPALRTSAKQPQFLNLIYRSLKKDIVERRVKAFLKRLMQTGSLMGPNFLCGALIVVSEIVKERPQLLAVKQMGKVIEGSFGDKPSGDAAKSDTAEADEEDDEEERFVDIPLPAEFEDQDCERPGTEQEKEKEPEQNKEKDNKPELQGAGSSWVHKNNFKGKSKELGYDCRQRNPLHCRAENECLWELQSLTHHYHPSVSLFARTVLQGQSIDYSGDPLQDFTLIRFLDRFVYKNPKKKEAGEARSETVGTASGKRKQSVESVPVNSDEFIKGGEEAVPEHERYLYRYFSQRAEKKQQEEDESEAESVSDSEFDAFLDKHERQMDHDDLDDMDFGLDFAGDMGGKKKGGKRKSKHEASSDEDMDDDDDDDDDDGDDDDFAGGLSDEEVDFGDDEDDELAAAFRQEMEGLGDGDEGDLEAEDFSGDELKQMMAGGSKKRGQKIAADFDMPQTKKVKKSRRGDFENTFASAEDFADVLEGNADNASAVKGTLDDILNTDKSSAKQIAWETKRMKKENGWRRKKHGRKSRK